MKHATAADETNARAVCSGRNTAQLINLQKVFWPKEGYTKGDVLAYQVGRDERFVARAGEGRSLR